MKTKYEKLNAYYFGLAKLIGAGQLYLDSGEIMYSVEKLDKDGNVIFFEHRTETGRRVKMSVCVEEFIERDNMVKLRLGLQTFTVLLRTVLLLRPVRMIELSDSLNKKEGFTWKATASAV